MTDSTNPHAPLETMQKVRLEIELEYDAESMHSGNADVEAKRWFMENVLLNTSEAGRLILHSNEIGDEIGTVRVLTVYPF